MEIVILAGIIILVAFGFIVFRKTKKADEYEAIVKTEVPTFVVEPIQGTPVAAVADTPPEVSSYADKGSQESWPFQIPEKVSVTSDAPKEEVQVPVVIVQSKDPRDADHDGTTSAEEKTAFALADARDINHDGKIDAIEKSVAKKQKKTSNTLAKKKK